MRLSSAVKVTWPTPQASDNRDRGHLGSGATQRRQEKGKQLGLSQSVSTESGALNPSWVAWLMGWPIGWTRFESLATDKCREWSRTHGIPCGVAEGCNADLSNSRDQKQ